MEIYFNQPFDKKRLKSLISWVLKTFGEEEALRVIEVLKETGFHYATQAGISIGLHDLTTPPQKPSLISNCQMTMNLTHQDFSGARITATERSQRIIDTWHRASDSLRKQVVDHFTNYDPFNPVYIMALSGARGNFSQVRQLVGMRGLMADQQGKIVSFPIRSNLREGLTLTEYFISCSGARKGLVDTALRTADTGYLTRRLVDVSHHVVVKRVRCNTHRKIAIKALHSYNKMLLTLKERLVGRVLAEDISVPQEISQDKTESSLPGSSESYMQKLANINVKQTCNITRVQNTLPRLNQENGVSQTAQNRPDLKINRVTVNSQFNDHLSEYPLLLSANGEQKRSKQEETLNTNQFQKKRVLHSKIILAEKDQEVSPKLAAKISLVRQQVYIRSPLTCQFTDSVCQLCYGWSMSQGGLVPLGDAVGVIAAQSIGEPGTQLTMQTFHTGGVFSGDLLQEIRAPHAGRVKFSQALQGIIIRTAQGRIAFLTKTPGELQLHSVSCSETMSTSNSLDSIESTPKRDRKLKVQETLKTSLPLSIPALTMLFVRQGERVEKNQLLAEFSIVTQEGNQPVKSRQTLFAELSGRVVEDRGGAALLKEIKEDVIEDLEDDLFRFIEPSKSGRLGFFKVLAARVGATFSSGHLIAPLKKPKNQNDRTPERQQSFVRKLYKTENGVTYCVLCTANNKLISKADYKTPFCKNSELCKNVNKSFLSSLFCNYPYSYSYSAKLSKKLNKELTSPLTFTSKSEYEHSMASENTQAKRQVLSRYANNLFRAQSVYTRLRDKDNFVKTTGKRVKNINLLVNQCKKYNHPDNVKKYAFCLQTIAEHGDIVDESYKNVFF